MSINAAANLLLMGEDSRIAIECGARRVSYGELRHAVARAAGAWQALGLAPDDRVLVFAPDGIEWVEAYLGAIWAGGVAVAVNPRLTMVELAPILNGSGARFVWTTADRTRELRDATTVLPEPPVVVALASVTGPDWSVECARARPIEPVARDADDMAFWIGTSGTTGTPKGVVHMQRATAPCAEFAQRVLRATCDDKFYATSKLFFAYALANSLFAALRLGATVVLDPQWPTPERAKGMVLQHRPTLFFSVPTLYHKMLSAGVAEQLAACGIRRFVSAGEVLPTSVRNSWHEKTGLTPLSGYGTSETLCLMLIEDPESGWLTPAPLAEIRHADSSAVLAGDEPQRIWLRHPSIARGYWQRPTETAEDFRDGWYSPGDMFLRHGDLLEFAGRRDDMLKIAGQWVSTQWVEQALRDACRETVAAVAAVGVHTEDGLAAIAAFLVAAPERETAARTRLAAGLTQMPGINRPRWIHWVPSVPQTANGKLHRAALGRLHLEQLKL